MAKAIKRGLENIHALIRTFTNQNIQHQISNLVSAGIGGITIVTNAAMDHNSTRYWIERVHRKNDWYAGAPIDINLEEMWLNYSWAMGLNKGMNLIRMKYSKDRSIPLYGLHCSVEAQVNREHLLQMLEGFDDPNVSIVGTTFVGRKSGNDISLGPTYSHPRNTCCLVDYRIHATGQMFNPQCDAWGGMEDLDAILQNIVVDGFKYKMVDAKVPLIIGNHHPQEAKEERELKASREIVRQWLGACSFGSATYWAVHHAVVDMGLKELLPKT